MPDANQETNPPVPPDSATPNAPAEAAGPPSAVWPGVTLDWNSPLTGIQLHVELPFWLFMPNADLDVSIDDCTLRVTITQNAVEIQRGKFFQSSHANVLHVEAPPPSEKAQEIVKATKEGVTFRVTRTLLTLQTRALADSLKALQDGGRRRLDASLYFQALAYARIPYVNKVIDSYRTVSSDPFALTVAEWDVPLWFASVGDHLTVISLLPYATHNQYPTVYTKDAKKETHGVSSFYHCFSDVRAERLALQGENDNMN
jgi:hypothetical protein